MRGDVARTEGASTEGASTEGAGTGGEAGAIPYRVLVGVTGHRRLPDDPALAEQVGRALERVRQLAPSSPHTPTCFGVVSPLAEGADRLVADAILVDPTATLEAPLPLPPEEYLADFETEESKREFAALLARASSIVAFPPAATREEAYERAGEYVVDRSDALVALWDGEPSRGRGGTAEIVDRARQRRVPLLWVRTEPPFEIAEEPGDGIATGAFEGLDRANRESIDRAAFGERCRGEAARLADEAERAGLDRAAARPFLEWICPYFVRADALALRHQAGFFRLGIGYFGVVALTVLISAGLTLFAEAQARRLGDLIEVALPIVLLALLFLERSRKPQQRWLAYRSLAERFRSALFLALAGVGAGCEVEADRIYLADPSEAWLGRAFDEVWARRPPPLASEAQLDGVGRFLADAWIGDQRRFHERRSERFRRLHRRANRISVALFGLSLVLAVLKLLFIPDADDGAESLQRKLVDLAGVSLPAFAGAVTAIRGQREYLRNAERYGRMVPALRLLERRMADAPDLATVRAVARDADEVMLDETGDWFVTMRATGVGPG